MLFDLCLLISYYHVLHNTNILDIVRRIILADWLATTTPGYDLNIVRNFSLEVFHKPTNNPKRKVIPFIFPLHDHKFYSGITYDTHDKNVSLQIQHFCSHPTYIKSNNFSVNNKRIKIYMTFA